MAYFHSGWYVIYTRPQQEKKITQELSEANVIFYLPLIKKISQWHDRKKVIEAPLFPNYVFARLNNLTDYYKGCQVTGFVRYIKFGEKYGVVDNAVIDSIKIAMAGENIETPACHFEPGQKLVINDGPLVGCQCELVNYKGNQKALIRLNMLNRNILVDLPASSVSPADSMLLAV
jgi:transcriptional antiterminator RfaH